MSAYRPYPKTKPSGVEWLGDVPVEWGVMKLSFVAYLRSGESITAMDIEETGTYPVFGGNGPRGFTERHTHDGHFVLVGRQGALCGNVHFTSGKFWASEHALVANPLRKYNTKWFGETLRAMNLGQYSVSAAQPGLSVENIGNLRLPFPPLPEQIQIAAFLDRECGKLDALQAKQERLIELLKEKRQALISHAVTRGLDPTAKLKPSGIEWLGDVPEHWRASKVKWVSVTVKTGGTPSDPSWFTDEPEVPWLTPGDFTEDFFKISPRRYVSQVAIAKREAPSFPSSSIFVIGIGATLGKVARLDERQSASSNQQINAIVPSKRIESDYLLFSLVAQTEQMKNCSNASTLGIMNQEKTKGLHIALPPLAEQRAIVAHLDEKCGKIDQLKAKAERGIELLKERRSALISATVTGKIDVQKIP